MVQGSPSMKFWSHRCDALSGFLLEIMAVGTFRLGKPLEIWHDEGAPARIHRFTLVESGMGVIAVDWR